VPETRVREIVTPDNYSWEGSKVRILGPYNGWGVKWSIYAGGLRFKKARGLKKEYHGWTRGTKIPTIG